MIRSASTERLATAAGGSSETLPSPLTPVPGFERWLLTSLAEASIEGILVVTVDGRVAFWNERFRELWRIPPRALSGGNDRRFLEMVREQVVDPDAFLARVEHLYAHPDQEARDEIRLRDGRVLDRHSAPVRGGDGRVYGRVWFFRDVTAERRRVERSLVLAEASRLLAGSLDVDAALQALARLVVGNLADWCAVDVLGDDLTYRRRAAAHVDPAGEAILHELDRRFPVVPDAGSVRGRVLSTGAPVALYEIDAAGIVRIARDADHLELIRRLGVASALWVPLTVGGRTIGVVSLGRTAAQRPFVPEDLVLAEEIASRAALAVDNATAYRRVRERERQQAEVARLGQAALSGIELKELFDAACEAIRATLGVEYAKVLELLPDGRHVRLVAGVGWRPGRVGTAILPVERTQAGYALLIGGPIVVDDLRTERRFGGPALLDEHGVVSGLSVAIAGAGGAWGVLGAHTTRRRRFTEDDVHFVQAVANVLAQAIERRRVEEAVLERDRRLELTLTASRTATWELDLRSGELTWSDRETEHGSTAPRSRRLPLDEYLDRIVHPADRELLRLAIERVVEEGAPLDVEFRILSGRTVRWMNGIARVFYDGSGAPARLLGIARDISARKRAEEERDRLLEAERTAHRLRETFVGVLSHELRTPITTIYGGVKVLARGGTGAGERASILQDVEAEADRLRRLVEDLLVIARAERGGLEVGADPVRIGNVVERVAAAEGARWPSVRFRLRVEPEAPLARGDETYLEQVLRNLIGNAAKYGPPEGTVEVAVEAGPGEVRVRVLDEGPGVAPEDLERVFDLFYRSPEAVRAASGAGIGLFVCRSLVEAMGGRVWAGRRPGGGAEFGFALQAYDDPGL